ncbi:MAG: GGDEF/EAL domain-containing response regulator [Acidiferrobacteraceae bacterium]
MMAGRRSSTRSVTEGIGILIVEASLTQGEHLKHFLEEQDFLVTLVTDSAQALAAARQHPPALVISDIIMPNMDGYALCKAIKSDNKLKDVPVMLVTSLSSAQDVMKGLECGADNFIRKPYESKYLLARINYILMNWELRRTQKIRMGTEILLGGQKHFITAERQQIVDLMISISEEAVHVNEELKASQRALSRSNQSLNGLYHIAIGLNGATSEHEVAGQALERAMELPGVLAGWVVLQDHEDSFRVVATRNLPPALATSGAFEGDCACRRWLRSGDLNGAINLECERLKQLGGDAQGLRYHASIALWVGNRRFGLMNLVGSDEQIFSDVDIRTLQGVGNQVAIALECAQIHQNLEQAVQQRTETLTTEIAERKLADVEIHKLLSAIEQAADSIFITNLKGVIEYANPAFEDTTGYSRQEAIGHTPKIVNSGRHDTTFYKILWATISAGKVYRDVFINRKKNGQLYYEESTITPLIGEHGEVTNYIFSGKDITERIQTEEKLYHLARHDVLTDLPNRALFVEHFKEAISRSRWSRRVVAVLFIDLDRFKLVNDTLGHEAGDQLLQACGTRLRESVREGDTVARFGGDEFAVLLDNVASLNDIAPIAQKLLDALTPLLTINNHEFFVTGSIGIGVYPDDGDSAQAVLKNADTAMYQAKQQGGNSYRFYQADMNTEALRRLDLEAHLRHALERQEFVLHYQPQVDLKTGRVTGCEALIRWERPGVGLVPPMEFIPLMEETGLIVLVGEWVLRTACAQHNAWRAAGLPALRMAVNVSGRQFAKGDLVGVVQRVMQESGMDQGMLELELTESVIMQNALAAVETLNILNGMGVRLAIDDFGTGYSSLSYLKRFPIDLLKIDQTFVRDITSDPDDAAIVRAIITMARSLDIDVIAEGVETREQLAFLHAQGCDQAQGYYFGKPQPGDVMEHEISREKAFSLSRVMGFPGGRARVNPG